MMPEGLAQSAVKESRTGMDLCSDSQLLAEIAQGSRAAFDAFFERHRTSVYNLALHIAACKELAEEAVQESMLRVWLSAKNVRADGNPEGWLKRIVARESIALVRRKQKERQKMERKRQLDSAPLRECEDPVEESELRRALHRKLKELCLPDRQLIALYYGAGMSQREIGEVLDIPQRSVSDRIDEVIGHLRSALSQAGLAAAVPLVSANGLEEAFVSGSSVPPGLREKVFARLGTHAGQAAQAFSQASCRMAAAKSSVAVWLLAGLVAVSAIAAAVAFGPKEASPPAAAPARQNEAAVASDSNAGAAPTIQDVPVRVMWSFAEGPSDDLLVLQGSWFWRRGTDGDRSGMVAPYTKSKFPALVQPRKFPKGKPFVVTARGKLLTIHEGGKTMGRGGMECCWLSRDEIPAYTRWLKPLDSQVGVTVETRIYCTGAHIVHTIENTPTMLCEYAMPYPGEYVYFNMESMIVYDIEIRALAEEEIPPVVRDVEAIKKRLGTRLERSAIPVPAGAWRMAKRGEKTSP